MHLTGDGGNMKVTRKELRTLIEGIFVGDADGTVLSPKDVDDFEYTGQMKDDEALGKHPKLDPLLKSKHLPTKKQGRQLAVTLGYQDDLTPYEELAVDHIDPKLIHSPGTPIDEFAKLNFIQAEITQDFKNYIYSPAGVKFVNDILANWIDFGYSLPKSMNFNHALISNHRGFDLKGRIYQALGYDISTSNPLNSAVRNVYLVLFKHLDSKLNKIAKERFNEKYQNVAKDQIAGKSFPLALTEAELKQMIMKELAERKKRKKKKKKKTKSKKRRYLYPYVYGHHDHDFHDYGYDIGDGGFDGGGDGGGGE